MPRETLVIARSASDEAIQNGTCDWIASLALAMTRHGNKDVDGRTESGHD